MDTTKILADLKKRPGFTENVGMVLVHNGVVRGWARADHAPVKSMKVSHDRAKMDAICREMEQQPGIFCIHAEAVEGELKPGDDVLFLVVARGHPRTRQGDVLGTPRPHQGRSRHQTGIHRIGLSRKAPARLCRTEAKAGAGAFPCSATATSRNPHGL